MSRSMSRVILMVLLPAVMLAAYSLVWGALALLARGLQSQLLGLYALREALACLASVLLAAGYWFAIWRDAVRWTPRRVKRTWIVAGVCSLIGVGAVLLQGLDNEWQNGSEVTFPVAVLWVVLTTFLWRDGPTEGVALQPGEPILCPSCHYNLTGLKGTQCPECGTAFTLDELLSGRAEREGSRPT